jgi:hypothetical protein
LQYLDLVFNALCGQYFGAVDVELVVGDSQGVFMFGIVSGYLPTSFLDVALEFWATKLLVLFGMFSWVD